MKKAKLITIPRVIPKGRLWLWPAIEDDKTIGRTGQMQGAKIVTSPDRNANINKSATINYIKKANLDFIYYLLSMSVADLVG